MLARQMLVELAVAAVDLVVLVAADLVVRATGQKGAGLLTSLPVATRGGYYGGDGEDALVMLRER